VTRRQFLLLIGPLLLVLAGFVVVFAVERSGPPGAPPWDDDFARRVRMTMSREYVWGTDDERKGWDAYFAALNSYVQTFDAYAEVVPPWDVEQSREGSTGQYPGIGIRIDIATGNRPVESIGIIGVKPGGPADKAGLRVGDRITAVGGVPMPELCPAGDEGPLKDAIRGAEGTRVIVRLRAPDGAEREVSVARGRIDQGSILGVRIADRETGVGYVRIHRFQSSTARDFVREVNRLRDEGMRSLVLDLRQNPGGLLDQALEVADCFVADGVLMRQRGRSGEYSETYRAHEKGTISTELPLAVLIDQGSASASEVLTGALQDHCRALVVGERSYGKFLVQIVEPLRMECGDALFRRTTSIYETPLGHHYQRAPGVRGRSDPLAGIAPDLSVAHDDPQMRDRVFLNEFYADWDPSAKNSYPDYVDPQLEAAVAALRGHTVYPRIVASGAREVVQARAKVPTGDTEPDAPEVAPDGDDEARRPDDDPR
jgi:carboxyl-terminal processing protease